eukprot:COSAG01_NODE_15431_length_1338_cov_1.087167_3_plen_79_part_00
MGDAPQVATYGSEDGFMAQLSLWRARQAVAPSATDFWESQDVDPIASSGAEALAAASAIIGEPHNYGPTAEDLAEQVS